MDPEPCFAHSANPAGHWHLLREHLASVAALARDLAGPAPWACEAELAGLLHDVAKYGDLFQGRLRGEHSGIDHWSLGAWIALRDHRALAAALACEGHHIGLQGADGDGLRRLNPANLVANHPLRLTLSDPDPEHLLARARADGLAFGAPREPALKSWAQVVAAMLDVRLLFSCLVDADFLDTEAHFEGDAAGKHHREPGPTLDPKAALAALDRYMAGIRARRAPDAEVASARATLWEAAGGAAALPPGAFTLTAPTGSGKTLAMLRFALKHAARHGLRRIVLAVPYLTVIEQTARVYRQVFAGFPRHFVLEHHSLAGLGDEPGRGDAEGSQERQRRLLAENWDAPIVLTTNVQLLESLFSNRPGACRKLHRLMSSVVLLDEAQTIPTRLAVPTLAALSHLAGAYGSSVVFATATQPAFDTLDPAVAKQAPGGWRPRELVPGHAALFAALKRVEVWWPAKGEHLSWETLAETLAQAHQVLAIVNLKRHALALLAILGEAPGTFHLSTNLCPEHRRAVLARIVARLAAGDPCRLVSTQCVEAGVDLDFPVVYRAMGPLDAIAQAAGRCNREGRLNALGGLGRVVVFDPDDTVEDRHRYPGFAYYQAAQVTRSLLYARGPLDIGDPETFRTYYRRLYDLTDPSAQGPDLTQALLARDFAEVARRYRLIEQAAIQILVPWAEGRDAFEDLRAQAEGPGIDGAWIRRAQGLAVAVRLPREGPPPWAIPAKLRRGGVSEEWFTLAGNYYDDTLGLLPPEGPQAFIA